MRGYPMMGTPADTAGLPTSACDFPWELSCNVEVARGSDHERPGAPTRYHGRTEKKHGTAHRRKHRTPHEYDNRVVRA